LEGGEDEFIHRVEGSRHLSLQKTSFLRAAIHMQRERDREQETIRTKWLSSNFSAILSHETTHNPLRDVTKPNTRSLRGAFLK